MGNEGAPWFGVYHATMWYVKRFFAAATFSGGRGDAEAHGFG